MSELLAEITIPKYITHVLISKKRRARYYKKGGTIPKRFKNPKFDKKGFLIVDGQKVIANSRSVGKEKYEKLSGNSFYTGYANPVRRAHLVKKLKEYYRPFVQEYVKKNGPITKFPIRVEWEIHTIVQEPFNWDISNLSFYYKFFEDCLFEKSDRNIPLIPDDNILYVTHAAAPKLIPIDDWEKRKFIFKIYHDNRPELRRYPWVQKTSSDI